MHRSNPACYSIFVVSLLVLSVTSSTAFAQHPPATTDPLVAQAQNLMQKGDSAQAMTKLNQVLAHTPKDLQARFLKGVLLTEMNKLNEAAAIFTRLTQDAPQLPEPYNNLAVIYAQQKQYDKARAALEMAIRTNPSYAVANENLGDLYAKMAREAYDRALQMDSSNIKAQAKLNLLRQITTGPVLPTITASRKSAPAASTVVTQTRGNAATTVAARKPTTAVTSSKPSIIAAAHASSSATSAPTPTPGIPNKPVAQASHSSSTPAEPSQAEIERKAVTAIINMVHAWAHAWSSKDAKTYLHFYGPDFDVPGKRSRKDWEAERVKRVTKPGPIHVSLSEINVQLEGKHASVRFKQHYDSAHFKSASGKTLTLVEHGGRWLIQSERIGR